MKEDGISKSKQRRLKQKVAREKASTELKELRKLRELQAGSSNKSVAANEQSRLEVGPGDKKPKVVLTPAKAKTSTVVLTPAPQSSRSKPIPVVLTPATSTPSTSTRK